MEHIRFDFSADLRIKPMHAVNNGPAGSPVRATGNDAAFAAAAIPYARNHDASFYSGYGGEDTVDVHRIFRDFSADENDPASYDFRATDEYVARTEAAGTHVYYRLGAAIEHGIKRGTFPPPDFLKWARICEHIIRHYNEGWADGFRYGITYWEIWNEPDCRNADNTYPCWQGTEEQFVDFFCTAFAYLKKTFPALKIGGPAFCGPEGGIQHKLLAALRDRGLRMDFYSFHCYTPWTEGIANTIEAADRMLAQYGMTGIETILNEWNYNCGWLGADFTRGIDVIKGQKGASFTAAVMCLGQASTLSMLMYYDARPCAYNGLFDTDTLRVLPGYYPFLYFGNLYRMEKAARVTEQPACVYACAAEKDGKKAFLLTRYMDTPVAYDEEVEIDLGLPADKSYRLTLRTTEEGKTDACTEMTVCGKIKLSLPLYTVLYGEVAEA